MNKQLIQVIHFIIFLSSITLQLHAGNGDSLDLGYEKLIESQPISIYRVDNIIIGRTNQSSPALLLNISPDNTDLLDFIKELQSRPIPKNKSEKIRPTSMEEFSLLERSTPLSGEEIKKNSKLIRNQKLNPNRGTALQRTKRNRNLKLEGPNLFIKKRAQKHKHHRTQKNKIKKRKYF